MLASGPDRIPHAVAFNDKLCIDGQEYVVLRAVPGERLHLQNITTGATRLDLSAYDYLELWRTDRAWVVRDLMSLSDRERARIERMVRKHYEDLNPSEKAALDRKLFYLRHLALGGCSFTRSDVETMLPDIARKYQQEMHVSNPTWVERPPHWRTVRQWRNIKETADNFMALAPDNAAKGNRKRRWDPLVCRLVDEGIRKRMVTGGSSTDVIAFVEKHLKNAFPDVPDDRLPTVSRQSINKLYKKLPAWYRHFKKFGPRSARVAFRGGEGLSPPEYALDVVEVDHTELPVLVYCHRRRMFLGRPVLALAVDVRTGMILGFYLGFMPEGDLTMMMCIKHAVTPKTYVRAMFPDIRNDWKAWGRWTTVVLDRAFQNFSESTKAICRALDTHIEWSKPYTPWMKPHVEALNAVIQRSCVKNLRINKLRDLWESDTAAAEETPVISFATLLHVIHKWIIDEHNEKPMNFLFDVPNDLWDESSQYNPPTLPPRHSDIDSIFGFTKTGQLSHRGIKYKHLIYHSDDFLRIRQECGRSVMVTFKLNPTDLARILVKHPFRDEYYPARVVPRLRPYAEGLTEYQHDRICAYAWNRFRTRGNYRAYLRAREEMHEILDQYFEVFNTGDRTRVARYEAIGTESVFHDLSWDGAISNFKGALAGQELAIAAIATREPAPLMTSAAATDAPVPLDSGGSVLSANASEMTSWPPPPTAPDHFHRPRTTGKSGRARREVKARVVQAPSEPIEPDVSEPRQIDEEEFAPRPKTSKAPALEVTISTFERKEHDGEPSRSVPDAV